MKYDGFFSICDNNNKRGKNRATTFSLMTIRRVTLGGMALARISIGKMTLGWMAVTLCKMTSTE